MGMMKNICLLVVFITDFSKNPQAADWSYADKDNWGTLFPEFCSGSSQSPIDLNSSMETRTLTDPGPIIFKGYDTMDSASISNTGHSVSLTFNESTPTISGGRLPAGETFDFLSLHWHWGSDASQGSEHTMDGKKYPLEVHLIHWNRLKYGSLGAALNHSDGLAVLGFFYEVSSEDDNDKYEDIIVMMAMIASPSTKREINATSGSPNLFCEEYAPHHPDCSKYRNSRSTTTLNYAHSLNQLLPSTGPGDAYFYYSGGLTSPNCNEAVLWTNFVSKIQISEFQLSNFPSMKDKAGNFLENNYRNPQPLNGRALNFRSQSQSWTSAMETDTGPSTVFMPTSTSAGTGDAVPSTGTSDMHTTVYSSGHTTVYSSGHMKMTTTEPAYQILVDCGCHEAKSCCQCGRNPYMCNGECTWFKSQCVKK